MRTHPRAGTVAAYLEGRLASAELDAMETHLADCSRCRAEIVQMDRLARPRRSVRMYVAALAAASAAALLFVAFPRALRPPDTPHASTSAEVTERLRALGQVAHAPIYLGVSIRAASEQGTRLFTSGMRFYADGKHAQAIADLQQARSAGVTGPAATFFLGAAHLMQGDARSAAEEFARVVAMGRTPYLAEAHYYRAKALLRLDDFGSAITELERSIQSGNEPARSIARSLRDSLRLLRPD